MVRCGSWLTRAVVGVGLLVGSSAFAAADPRVPVQGALVSGGGSAAADGKYVLFFKLYASQESAEVLWQEVQPEVAVAGGRFSTALGDADAKGVPAALFGTGVPLWLGVRVGSDPELPRVRLGTTPYAIWSATAQTAQSLQCSGCVGAAQLAAGAVQASHVAFGYAAADKPAGSATHALVADAATTANQANQASLADTALQLNCTGCVTAAMLHPKVLSDHTASLQLATVAKSGSYKDLKDTPTPLPPPDLSGYARTDQPNTFAQSQVLSGGADFALAQAQRMRLHNADEAPAPCNAQTSGLVWFQPKTANLWVCNGQAYVAIVLASLGAQTNPGTTCKAIKAQVPSAIDGVYWLDVDGASGPKGAFQAYCDMTTAGGGWTVLARAAFGQGPDLFAGNFARDGQGWRADAGLSQLQSGSFVHDIRKFIDAGVLNAQSEFMVRSGGKVAKGSGLTWLPTPLPESSPHHTRYGSVTLDGKPYTITSPCYDGCCGAHTNAWDMPIFMQGYAAGSGDISSDGQANQPIIGWVDHYCNIDGFDTTPGWNLTFGNKNNAAQRFDADLFVQFR